MPTEPTHLLSTSKGDVLLAWLERPFAFVSPFAGGDFALMLFIASDEMSAEEQAALSDALVAQGCRYAVCCGHRCSTWDDSIDYAFLHTDPDLNPPDDRFVMTTWHDDEPLAEVAWFFLWNTEYDEYVPERFLALAVGGTKATLEELGSALQTAATDDGAA